MRSANPVGDLPELVGDCVWNPVANRGAFDLDKRSWAAHEVADPKRPASSAVAASFATDRLECCPGGVSPSPSPPGPVAPLLGLRPALPSSPVLPLSAWSFCPASRRLSCFLLPLCNNNGWGKEDRPLRTSQKSTPEIVGRVGGGGVGVWGAVEERRVTVPEPV